jgi:hypothetical protein
VLPVQGCTQSANLEFGLNVGSVVAVVGFSINVNANTPMLVITNSGNNCGGPSRSPEQGWKWRVDVPQGSHSQLSGTSTLSVSFTPDKPGQYTVHLNGCGDHCTIKLVTDFANGMPIREDVDIGDPERQMVFTVAEQAQVPPRITPPPAPSPAGASATDPQHYDTARSACGGVVSIALDSAPEWFTTTIWQTAAPHLELVEGRVYDSSVSRIDTPFEHHENDASVKLEVDPWLRRLLVDDTPRDKGPENPELPFGGLEVEWEWPQWLEGFRPLAGDRMSALGFHVVDCGHDIATEIHPPIAVATHRVLPVQLPTSTSLEEGQPAVPIGSNLYVPGIVTDIFVNFSGGKVLECAHGSLAQPVEVVDPTHEPPVTFPHCVPQADQPGIPFTFNVYLPINPQRVIKSLVGGTPPIPALFTQIVNHPDAPPGARIDIPVTIVDRQSHLDSDTPYITVSVDISNMRAGQVFVKRLISAWVYPDFSGHNFGLEALRLRLDRLEVTDTGDSIGAGDTRLWVGFPNAVRPWTRLIFCDDCVDQKTYSSSDLQAVSFRAGRNGIAGQLGGPALGTGGALKGELLRFKDFFPFSRGRLRMTGYEQDTFGSDDVGEVDSFLGGPGPFLLDAFSTCDNQTAGTLGINPANSGCAAYVAHFIVEAGQTPVAGVLSPQARAFISRLMVGKPLLTTSVQITDSELFAGPVTSRVARLTRHRVVESELWQDAFEPAALALHLAEPKNAENVVKTLRAQALQMLGAHPTPRQRTKVKADLQKLKPSIPVALYQKFLCDLETGQPCPATP